MTVKFRYLQGLCNNNKKELGGISLHANYQLCSSSKFKFPDLQISG